MPHSVLVVFASCFAAFLPRVPVPFGFSDVLGRGRWAAVAGRDGRAGADSEDAEEVAGLRRASTLDVGCWVWMTSLRYAVDWESVVFELDAVLDALAFALLLFVLFGPGPIIFCVARSATAPFFSN